MKTTLYPVAILAGGMATRMRPLTEKIPKSLLEVNGDPFVAHQLRLLAGHGVARVVLCVGHQGDKIEQFVGSGARFGLQVSYSHDGDRLLGTAGALKRALPLLGDAFFVMYGDSYLPCNFRAVQATFRQSGRLALMTVFRNAGQFDRSNILFTNGMIRVYDKANPTSDMQHIDYGLGILDSRALATVRDGEPCCLADLYRMLLARYQVVAHEVPERFFEIGSFAGLEETCQYLRTTARARQSA